jgi:hypothetical protein
VNESGWPIEPVTVNKDGSVVIETENSETRERRQLIFKKAPGGWMLHVCYLGVGPMPISFAQANVLAYALRAARGGENA